MLLILVAGIGDFVLATPAIRTFAAGFPGVELTLLTTPQAAELARPCPHFREVVPFDLRTYRPGEHGIGWQAWRRFREVATHLRSRRFAVAVNLYEVATWSGALRMALLLRGVRAGRTAGRWSGGRGMIFDVRSPDRPHALDAMLALTATLGCQPDEAEPTLWVTEASRQAAADVLHASGLPAPAPYVVLHAGSNKPEARLPEAAAADIARRIGRVFQVQTVLTGDAGEAAATERLVGRIGHDALSVAGRTTLLELAAILAGARAAVTTDSGPMHLAAAVGTPLVALFGPGDPRRFGPRGCAGQIAVLQGKSRPHDPVRWHTDITTDDVLDALASRVHDRRSRATR